MGYAKRIDVNQKDIVQALRKMGCAVAITSMVGCGFPDLAVSFGGRNYFFEVKDGAKPPSQRKLTPAEQVFFESWKGQICIINSVEEAVEFINKENRCLENCQCFGKD